MQQTLQMAKNVSFLKRLIRHWRCGPSGGGYCPAEAYPLNGCSAACPAARCEHQAGYATSDLRLILLNDADCRWIVLDTWLSAWWRRNHAHRCRIKRWAKWLHWWNFRRY